MNPLQDVFISYGRADSKQFAKRLNDRLVAEGLEVWFDFDDIPLGVDYQKQIDDGIEKADNFLFIISPHAINSPYCRLEVELALQRGKRIIPVLHVEAIDRELWQQRYPTGTDAEWDEYTAAGKHASFPNMPPEIGKINWVYMREDLDDFEASFQGLLAIFARDRDYVHHHTMLLQAALTWEAHQRQTPFLLTSEQRSQAESWLHQRFSDRQPPCEPTVLHCEYITASIKQAQGGMTAAFLSYADEDKAVTEQVRQLLMREGLTVWTNYTDLTTGEDFQSAIDRGIEATDTLVLVVSPAAIASAYCYHEVQYALSLHKRIVPLLYQPVAGEPLVEDWAAIQSLQYIDVTHWSAATPVPQRDEPAVSQLLNILQTDAGYYQRHKVALTQALKWDRQSRPPGLLLRGNTLRQFEGWLAVAQERSQSPALSLQTEFIEASRNQPEDLTLDVFLAYADEDVEFAAQLNAALQNQGKSTWFDEESIDAAADYQAELNEGIEQADNIVFIVSPAAIALTSCLKSLSYAASLDKRIIPVQLQPVEVTSLPPAIQALKAIDFQTYRSDFYEKYSELVRTLDRDRDHIRGHTKWLNRSLEWEAEGRPNDMLLRGNELAVAEGWLQQAIALHKLPVPSALQKTFCQESRAVVAAAEQAEKERQEKILRLQQERAQEAEARLSAEQRSARVQKFFLGAVSVGFAIACGLSFSTWRQYHRSLINELVATTKSSAALFASNRKLQAIVEAIRAQNQLSQLRGEHPDLAAAADEVLQQAIYGVRATNQLVGHEDWVVATAFSPNGQQLASGDKAGVIKIWQADGKLLHTLAAHDRGVWGLAFSPDEQHLVSGGADHQVRIWDTDGTLVRTLSGHEDIVAGVAYSPDGRVIASVSVDQTLRLWTAAGEPMGVFDQNKGYVVSVAFSPDSRQVAATTTDGLVTIWNRTGEKVAVLKGHTGPVWNVAFSPDGQTIASVGADGTIKLWSLDGTLIKTMEGHRDDVEGIAFSPDGQYIVSGGADHTVRLWRRDGTPIAIFRGHEDWVWSVSMSPDGQTIASGGGDNLVTLWRLSDLFTTLEGHSTEVWDVAMSPNNQLIASAVGDGTVWLWERDGSLRQQIKAHTSGIEQVAFSPDSQAIATASWDTTIKLWDLAGNLQQTFEGHDNWVLGVRFSPDGQLLASCSEDGTVRIWQRTGESVAVMGVGENYGAADGLSFSPDGQFIAVAFEDHVVRIWDRAGNLVQELIGHEGPVYSTAFSPDGQMLASAGADRTIRLWNRDGELLQTLTGHEDWVWRVAFSPDGQTLASGGNDRTVRLWSVDGMLLKTFRGHQAAVEGIQFSPDGQTLASASWDTRVILWNLEEAGDIDPLTYGCDWIRGYLAHSADVDDQDRTLCDRAAP